MRRALVLAALLGCGGKDPGDTGDAVGDTADTGGRDTGGDTAAADLWAWCPAEATTSGDVPLIVGDGALYCAIGVGEDLADELAAHVQVRVVPGVYALPSGDGTVDYMLPVCLRGADEDVASTMAGTGTLTTTTSDFPYTGWWLDGQPLTFAGDPWTFGFSLTAFPQEGAMPPVVLDERLRHGDYPDTEAFVWVCRGDCATDQRYVWPCGVREPQEAPTLTVTFDRGWLSVWVEVVESFGPAVPAVFYRAEGELDGVGFSQADYWDLAHLPDHHNRGGGFLVRFDAPIGGACGLLAEVPSDDGSFRFERLRAATVDCAGAVVEELAGVGVE